MNKGILFYNSATGNTRAACERIGRGFKSNSLELRDCSAPGDFSFSKYDFAGFATFTDYLGAHARILDFIDSLPRQNGMPVFMFNTCGGSSGRTLTDMKKHLRRKGFRIITGFTLDAPENYPPFISRGNTQAQLPGETNCNAFKNWMKHIDEIFGGDCLSLRPEKIPSNVLSKIVPPLPRRMSHFFMGGKSIDETRCTKCGLCERICDWKAIEMTNYPTFDEKRCYGCWACYNRCPTKAIYTKNYRNKGHYPSPLDSYLEKILK
jgi:ferredoxin